MSVYGVQVYGVAGEEDVCILGGLGGQGGLELGVAEVAVSVQVVGQEEGLGLAGAVF